MTKEYWEDSDEDNDGECDNESDSGCVLAKESSILYVDDPGYQVLDIEDVSNLVHEMSSKIAAIIGLDPAPTRLLLQHYRFNEEKLLEEFTSGTDIEVLFAEILNVDCTDSLTFNTYEGECELCCEEGVMLTGFKCGHICCIGCWNNYIKNEIMSNGNAFISCYEAQCNIKLDDQQVRTLLTEEDVKLKYNHLLTKLLVDGNEMLRWCKGNNCKKILQLFSNKPLSVYCHCGENFCPACPEIAHRPLACSRVKQWFSDVKQEGESVKWITANSRPCPKCKIPIEKTGGCNFMKCTSPACQADFCWGCMQVLSQSHAGHNCFTFTGNAFDSPDILDMNRFNHYYGRFVLHRTSEEMEAAIKEKVEDCCNTMESNCFPTADISSFKMAYHELLECRRVLAFCNSFSYYLKDEPTREILENNVEHLEGNTEKLAELFGPDSPIWCSNVDTVREYLVTMIEYMTHMRRCRYKLLEHCEECDDYCSN